MTAEMHEVTFSSAGTTCRAYHIQPEDSVLQGSRGTPCIILGHGFGGTRDMGLEPFARRFAAAGMHALVFDYRHFGASDGEPRQLISIKRQLADWQAAISFARTLPGVDPECIGLFGTSFSGGHVIEAAVRDGRVAAVVSQGAMMDGRAALRNLYSYAGAGYLLRMTWYGLRDVAHSLLGRQPVMLPIVAPPGNLAAMSSPDAEAGVQAIAPPSWRNEVCARIGLTMGAYRPGLKTDRLPCPILIQICEKDSVAPAAAAEAAARRAGRRATVIRYPIGHFSIYVDQGFKHAVADQVEFLTTVLSSGVSEK